VSADEDAFDRAARREAEIAEELARGRLSAEEAELLRDLAAGTENASGPGGKQSLSFDQLRRVIDEGVDPELLALGLRLSGRLSVAEILDLLVDLCPDEAFLRALDDPVLSDLGYRDVVALAERDVDPEGLARLRRAGVALGAREAVELVDSGADLDDVAAELASQPWPGLTSRDLTRICAEGVDLPDVRKLVEAGAELDQAVDLASHGLDPSILDRLAEAGVDIDFSELSSAFPKSPWAGTVVGFKSRRRHIGLILGDDTVASDASVSGIVLGSVTVLSGSHSRLDAWIGGDVVVQPLAQVEIGGFVRGRVINRGGDISVTGTVRGGVVDEEPEANFA